MPKSANNSNSSFELKCSLCPKNPNFSDVSHLLTHISSKSHLSHRFKLQIRAQSELEAKGKLDLFDRWYQDNGIDVMLSARLAAKEQKKNRKARITNTSMKSEVKAEKGATQDPVLASTPIFRAPVPRMHLWTTTNAALTASTTPSGKWNQTSIYETPTARRQIPNFAHQDNLTSGMHQEMITTPRMPMQADHQKSAEKLTESNKLKGVLWPGMALFDSATPEMKRMRNQRKDRTVLEQMMATSAGVEPTEIIYNADGQLSHTRDIFGPLSTDTSPNKVMEPTPKKRKTRKTTAMSDISVNAPRMRAPRPKKSSIAKTPLKRPPMYMQNRGIPAHPLGPPPILNPLAGFGQRYAPTAEEDEEFRMTVDDMTKKRGFNIFQDAPEVSPGMSNEAALHILSSWRPGRTESPLEDHRFDFSGERLPTYPSVNPSNYISPTPVARSAAIRVSGKENGQPEMPSQFHVQRTFSTSTSHIYPGQVFYDPNFNPLYNHAFARSFPTYGGQHHNYNEGAKPPTGYPAYTEDFKPAFPNAHGSGQQGYGAVSNNTGHSIQFGM